MEKDQDISEEIEEKKNQKDKQKEFVLEYYDAQGLIQFAKNYKDVKTSQIDVHFATFAQIIDIGVNARGAMECEAFTQDMNEYNNIRQGLSIMKINEAKVPPIQDVKEQEEEQKEKVESNNITTFILRKGLPKFFELQIQHIESKDKGIKPNPKILQSKSQQQIQQFTYDALQARFSSGQQITMKIYNQVQADGENVEITYCERLDAWSISNKYQTIVARNQFEVVPYDTQNYRLVKTVASDWFRLLQSQSETDIENLKLFLQNHTLIGEYCGNHQFKFLVQYQQIDIHFFAIVKKDSRDICLLPSDAYRIFQQFGFTCVPMKYNEVDSLEKMNDYLYNSFKEVSENPIELVNQGSVLYFVQHDVETGNNEVFNIVQLISLEFKILSILREQLKETFREGLNEQKTSNFIKEITEISENFKPPNGLDFYFKLGEGVLKFLDQGYEKDDKQLITDNFTHLIDLVKDNLIKGSPISKQIIIESLQKFPLTKEQQEDKWNKECSEQVGGKSLITTNLVIIAPPFYLTHELLQALLFHYKLKTIEEDYNEKGGSGGEFTITWLDQPSQLKYLKNNINKRKIICLFLGWNETVIEKILNQVSQKDIVPKYKNQFEFMEIVEKQKFLINSLVSLKYVISSFDEDEEIVYRLIDDVYQPQTSDLVLTSILQEIQKLIKIKFENDQRRFEILENQQKFLSQKQIILLLPMTLPASGKSTFLKYLQTQYANQENQTDNFQLSYLSNDELRSEIMAQLKTEERSKHCTQHELYELSGLRSLDLFNLRLEGIVQKTCDSTHMKHIIFIDKNHPEVAAQGTIDHVRGLVRSNEFLKIIALTPKIDNPLKIEKDQYPMSTAYLIVCIHRALQRGQNHETVRVSDEVIVNIVGKFFSAFKNIDLSETSLKRVGFDGILTIPFHLEENQANIPGELQEIAIEYLKSSNSRTESNSKDVQLLEALIKTKFEEKSIDQTELFSNFQIELNSVLELFQNKK